MGADYAALRSDLMDVLAEQRAKGRFAWMTEAVDQTQTTLFLSDLARAIAEILVTACPNKDSAACAAVLADAAILARSLLPTSPPTTNYWHAPENVYSSHRTIAKPS